MKKAQKSFEVEKTIAFCNCGSTGHLLIMTWFSDETETYLTYQLDHGSFWWRLKKALVYLFKSERMCQEEIILEPPEFKKLFKEVQARQEVLEKTCKT